MNEVSVVVAHHERVTLRVGDDVFVKVDAEDWRIEREAAALALVAPSGVPVPSVVWRRPNVLALGTLPGSPLGLLGQKSASSAAAWRAAGAIARSIHALPLPPWTAWDHDGFRSYLAGEARWLVNHEIASIDIIERMQQLDDADRRHLVVDQPSGLAVEVGAEAVVVPRRPRREGQLVDAAGDRTRRPPRRWG